MENELKRFIGELVKHKWGFNKQIGASQLVMELKTALQKNDRDLFNFFVSEYKGDRDLFRIKYFCGTGGDSELNGDYSAICECQGGSHKWRALKI